MARWRCIAGATLASTLTCGCPADDASPADDATTNVGTTTAESTTGPSDDTTSSGGSSTSAADESSDGSSESTGAPGCLHGDAMPPTTAPAAAGSLVDDPLAELPDALSDLGLYPALPDLSVTADVAVDYVPTWALWSNGSTKARYLVLPTGAAIDTSEQDRFVAPVGTLLFKTFAYADGPDGCSRPVETRVMRKAEDGTWDYAAYGWHEDGLDAARLDLSDNVPVDVEGPDGPFVHHVPARIECRGCHESSTSELLGLSRVQLTDDAGTLDAWLEAGILSDPVTPQTIEHPDETTRLVLGMFHGNCVHCHNGSFGPSSSFDLRHDVALANTIDQPTESSASASGIRIVPGSPETSILFLAFSGETDDPEVSAMPPMGVDVRDAEAVEVLRSFILDLEP